MDQAFRTYKYRWVIVAAIMPIIISTQIFWLSLSPVASLAAVYYKGAGSLGISMFAMSYFIMFVAFTFPASWVIDKYGYRASLIIGAAGTAVFGVLRAVFAADFTLTLIFQFCIAACQPFLLNISTKVPANWFPVSERSTAAGLLTMAQYLGFIVPMVLSPILVDPAGLGDALKNNPAQIAIPEMFKVYAIIAVVCAIVAIVLTKERPPIPPGPEAEKEDLSLKSMGRLFKNGAFGYVMLIVFISMGVFNTLLTEIESILGPRGITSDEAGLVGAVFVICGVIGAFVLPIISDKKRSRTPLFIIAITALVPLYLGITFLSGFALLCIAAGLAGFAIMGVAPILFQHGAEVAYPVKEGTSFGVIILMGQISGTLFVLLYEWLNGTTHSILLPMLVFIGLSALQIPFVVHMKESKILLELREQAKK
jgi:FLVCR family MFS transporter 7